MWKRVPEVPLTSQHHAGEEHGYLASFEINLRRIKGGSESGRSPEHTLRITGIEHARIQQARKGSRQATDGKRRRAGRMTDRVVLLEQR